MRTVSRAARQPRRFRPALFALEGRRLLSTFMVDDDLKQCPDADFTSIQAAVDAAGPNDTIEVCPGTYQEQVLIPVGKDNLTLVSEKRGKATIQAPATQTPGQTAIVEVDAQDAEIDGFTITGPSQDIQFGVLIDQGGSATVQNNRITNIRNQPLGSGPADGVAVAVRHGTGHILHNTIDQYQKDGVLVGNSDSFAEIAFNTIRGVGPTGVVAQNGIQISNGATADIHDNKVSDNIYTGTDFAAGGILLVNPGEGVMVRDNEVTRNDKGIFLQGAVGAVVSGNSVSRSTEDGISLTGGTTGTVVDNNDSRKNGLDGIFVDGSSTNNTISNNELKQNALFDAEDQSTGAGTAGTANTWTNNEGKTSSPPGLVQKKADHGHGHGHDDDHGHGHGHGDDHGHGHDDDNEDDDGDSPPRAHGRRHADDRDDD